MPTLIDPQQIYPRRMGLYRGSLVIQYYNFQKDCFKRHAIPFDSSDSADKAVQTMLKNPKHSVFLRKIAPHHIKQAISGKNIQILPPDINQRSSLENYERDNSRFDSRNQYSNSLNQNKTSSNQSYNPSSSNSRSGSGSGSGSGLVSGSGTSSGNSYITGSPYNSNNSYSNNTSSQNQSHQSGPSWTNSNSSYEKPSSADKWGAFKKKDAEESGSFNLSTSKVNESRPSDRRHSENNLQDSHGYSMNFQQQSISVVHMKQPQKHQNPIDQQIQNYEQDFQELSAQKLQIPKPKPNPKQKAEQKVEKEAKKQKKPKKKQKQLQQFQFLDESPKKKKKKKKEKEKSKQKQSKSNASSISANVSKQISVKQEVPIQQQFDFI